MSRTWIFVAVWAVVALPVACGLFPDTDGLTGGGGATEDAPAEGATGNGDATAFDANALDASAPDATTLDASDASDASDAEAAAPGCPTGRGPAMVDVGVFCIDATEVTQAHYAAFLAAVDKPTQPAFCAWNTDLSSKTTGGCLWNPAGYPNLPVTCVDWCDAWSFCEWSGKRLCGAIDGGSLALDEYAAPHGQWEYACSHDGDRAYPYGVSYDGTAGCNGADAAATTAPYLLPAGSRPGCVGGFEGVQDMSGNVREWIDACGPCGGGRCCSHIGGAYENSAANLACIPPNGGAVIADENTIDVSVGFRCCSR